MRWILLSLGLMAFTPLFSDHNTTDKVNQEIRNIEESVQSQQFTVFKATPVLNELKDGQVVIVASGTWNNIMFRNGQEIYKIITSCVTVYRGN